ncbi:hypothetical protein LINGRAHAP2_LOCUS14825 [Linum grandiflorum]
MQPDSKGKFSVKSAYHTIRKETLTHQVTNGGQVEMGMWKWMWRIPIPPKYGFFVWRATHNVLATKFNLWQRKCSPTPLCQLCHNKIETTFHCLFYCKCADETWR